MLPRRAILATFAATAGAAIWAVGIGVAWSAYNRQHAAGYLPWDHFISELGFPGASPLTWVFNLAETIGSLASLPIVFAFAAHLRTRLGYVAAGLATLAFLSASAVGAMGLRIDLLRPEHVPWAFLQAHAGAAVACFASWWAAVTLFTCALWRRRDGPDGRFLLVIGVVCFVVAASLFGAGVLAARELGAAGGWSDPAIRAIARSQATPQVFLAWLEAYRATVATTAVSEWSLLGTIFLWHGAVVLFLWRRATEVTSVERTQLFARWLSIVGHPFTFIVLLLSVPFLQRGQIGALRIAGIVTLIALVPLGLFMRERWRSGRWETVDASARRDRPMAYAAASAVLAAVILYFWLVERSPALVRGGLVTGGLFAVGAALNRWIKGSGHMAFAALSAVVFTRVAIVPAIAVGLFLPLLGWSRIALRRHTPGEVIGGSVLGAIAGGVMLTVV